MSPQAKQQIGKAAAWAAPFVAAALVWAAKAFAGQEVRPLEQRAVAVEQRVTVLETQREEDVKKIDEMRGDIKELLRRVSTNP